ncbi:AP-3 complex subunit beta-2-like [Saccoglossus kowalevskii]|uniref:AP-3 complex subunit beta n=1 Tax=Saccoglossus kowalevskii TaxID=10224 RepID=A0ABM0LWF0_SACKO|nr:PREDICTED: AP-3 complex subunit beta-2-like [Saccoglossus kowalevskii]
MAHNSTEHRSYANERPASLSGSGETTDIATDPASGGIFAADYKKHEDLKQMLDSNKDNLKLEAMKRIIGMVAKGKDASDLFAAVVKNVVSKKIEIKKLVYVYLVRYAEEQQDLALLSISTFQKGLKDPNQLIRASALRVLSSIRVPVIVPIMMLAIKEAVNDMSPYVRKTAAHAIPKLYCLDPELKEQLIEVIEKLLSDKTTLVAGSVVYSFEEVCPERIDLIHKSYRKLCNLLIDVEEWGQVVIINMLTRYSRTQFLDPNAGEAVAEDLPENFYGSDDSDKEETNEAVVVNVKKPYVMDSDHRLLLRNCKPLLQSRNAAVVMAVAQLYHHIAPKSEVGIVAKPLVRLLRSHREVQSIVLSNIATMSAKRRGMFEPFLKSFFVRANDPTHIRLLKLEILTNLASETSISTILREFQTYVTSADKNFVAATIQAIGRCASNIAEVTDTCLNGLMGLMSNRDESVVGESVVVMKKLLQMNPTEHKEIIRHLARLTESISVPMARASILWLIGEYSDRVPKIAPDVLRKMAKTFITEEDIVKLQILNLGAKLYLTNSKQTKLLCQYVLNLAKYDQNYDIRDRARFLRQLLFPSEKGGALNKHAKKMFLASKPAPVLESQFKDRDQFQLGSLSHIINSKTIGYHELPEFPEEAPDPTVRNVEMPAPWDEPMSTGKIFKKMKPRKFYSSDEAEESNSESGSDSSDSSTTSSDSDSDSDSSSDEESEEEEKRKVRKKKRVVTKLDEDESIESNSDSSSSSSSSSSSDSDSSEESSEESDSDENEKIKLQPKTKTKPVASPKREGKKHKSSDKTQQSQVQLLDFDDIGSPPSTVTNHIQDQSVLVPVLSSDLQGLSLNNVGNISVTTAMKSPTQTHELLNRMHGQGLSAVYRFTRGTCIYSTTMVPIELTITNTSDVVIKCIKMGETKLKGDMKIHQFQEIPSLAVGKSVNTSLGIDFADTTQPANFEICTETRKFNVTINAPGRSKLRGMNENIGKVEIPAANNERKKIIECIADVANVQVVPLSDLEEQVYRLAGRTASTGALCLVSVKSNDSGEGSITVNCEKMVIGNMLVKDIKNSLSKVK